MQRGPLAQRLEVAFGGRVRQALGGAYRLLLLTAALWACQWCLRRVWSFTIDDAGISYAYAKHLAEGDGPVAAVGGPWIEGYSNPSWVFLLVPFHWLGFALPELAKVLGVALLGAGMLFGSQLLASDEGRPLRAFGALDAALCAAFAVCLEIVVWSVAGLENSLFSALLLALVVLSTARADQRGRALQASAGACAFALSITRPEGFAYVAPWLLLEAASTLRAYRRGQLAQAQPWGPVICIALLAAYHALHYFVFRDFVPNTYYAKSRSDDLGAGYDYLVTHLGGSGLLYAAPLCLIGAWGKARPRLLLIASIALGSMFVLYSGGDWMPHGRFVSLFAPSILVLAALGVSNLCRAVRHLSRGRVPRELSSFVLAAGLLGVWWSHHAPRLQAVAERAWCHFCERVADTKRLKSLARRAGLAHPSLLTHDFGGPAWLSDNYLYPIDFLGLCDASAALIRRDHNRVGGPMSHDFRFYQYFMHEQPSPPSFVYVPANFWRRFTLSPEYRWGYFDLAPSLLRYARRDAHFGLHRAELVDYFPPLAALENRPLPGKLALVGAAYFVAPQAPGAAESAGHVAPGARVSALVSVVPRGTLGDRQALALRIHAGSESVTSAPVRLGRGISGIAKQLSRGEPLSLEFDLELPGAHADIYRVELGSSLDGGKSFEFGALGELAGGAPLPAHRRLLPRFPRALPPPLTPELRAFREVVTGATERRRRFGHAVPPLEGPRRELESLGAELEAQGQTAQAYLAYVWATEVDRRAWRDLAEPIFRLRETPMDASFVTELALLRRYYSAPSPAALAHLSVHYLAQSRPLEARYFLERSPEKLEPSLHATLSQALEEALARRGAVPDAASLLDLVAFDPVPGGSDFETDALSGWQGARESYLAGMRRSRSVLGGLRGQHRHGVLASLAQGKSGRGELLSPEFVLQGRMLTLLVGGGSRKRKVGVELLVDGIQVASAHGNDSDFMSLQVWDIAEHAGKAAQLRVFDGNKRSHVLLDRVLAWR